MYSYHAVHILNSFQVVKVVYATLIIFMHTYQLDKEKIHYSRAQSMLTTANSILTTKID